MEQWRISMVILSTMVALLLLAVKRCMANSGNAARWDWAVNLAVIALVSTTACINYVYSEPVKVQLDHQVLGLATVAAAIMADLIYSNTSSNNSSSNDGNASNSNHEKKNPERGENMRNLSFSSEDGVMETTANPKITKFKSKLPHPSTEEDEPVPKEREKYMSKSHLAKFKSRSPAGKEEYQSCDSEEPRDSDIGSLKARGIFNRRQDIRTHSRGNPKKGMALLKETAGPSLDKTDDPGYSGLSSKANWIPSLNSILFMTCALLCSVGGFILANNGQSLSSFPASLLMPLGLLSAFTAFNYLYSNIGNSANQGGKVIKPEQNHNLSPNMGQILEANSKDVVNKWPPPPLKNIGLKAVAAGDMGSKGSKNTCYTGSINAKKGGSDSVITSSTTGHGYLDSLSRRRSSAACFILILIILGGYIKLQRLRYKESLPLSQRPFVWVVLAIGGLLAAMGWSILRNVNVKQTPLLKRQVTKKRTVIG